IAGLLTGSEGTLGIFTSLTLRLMPIPREASTLLASFATVNAASATVAAVIAAGMVPAAIEMMDRDIIHAVEAYIHAGYPLDAEAVLVIELDGDARTVGVETERIRAICDAHRAKEVRSARDEEERERL